MPKSQVQPINAEHSSQLGTGDAMIRVLLFLLFRCGRRCLLLDLTIAAAVLLDHGLAAAAAAGIATAVATTAAAGVATRLATAAATVTTAAFATVRLLFATARLFTA